MHRLFATRRCRLTWHVTFLAAGLAFCAAPRALSAQEAAQDHPDDRDAALAERNRLWNEANVQLDQAKPKEAIEALLKVVAIERRVLGDDHPDVASSLDLLGECYVQVDDLDAARKAFSQALELQTGIRARHDQLADARWQLRHVEILAALKPEQRLELVDAARLNAESLALADRGLVDEALAAITKALDVRRRLLPNPHPQTASSLNNMGYVLSERHNDRDALKFYQESVDMRERLFPKEDCPQGHPIIALSFNNLANALYSLNDLNGAIEMERRVLAMREALYPPEEFPRGHALIAKALNQLEFFLSEKGEQKEALDLARRSLAMNESLYPVDDYPDGHTELAQALDNLAYLIRGTGDFAQAREYYERALDMRTRLYPAEDYPDGHPDLARSLHSMGRLSELVNDSKNARDYYLRAVAMRQKLYPAERYPNGHPELATSLNNLSVVYFDLSDLRKAIEYGEQALAMREKLFPEELFPQGHPDVAQSVSNMAAFYNAQGNFTKAREFYERALHISERTFPPEAYPHGHPELASNLNNLAGFLSDAGEYTASMEYYRRALEMNEGLYPPADYPHGHPDVARAHNNLGHLLHDMGDYAGARPYFERGYAVNREYYPEKQFPDGHPDLALCLNNMGFLLTSQANFAEARTYFEQALAMRRRLYPADLFPRGHDDLATSLHNLAMVLEDLGDYAGSRAQFEEALAMTQKLYPAEDFPQGHPEIAATYISMAGLLDTQGQFAEGQQFYEQALAIYERVFNEADYPQGHPELMQCLTNLGTHFDDVKDYDRALTYYQRALDMSKELYSAERFPGGHPRLASLLNNVGFLHQMRDSFEEGERDLKLALEMRERLFPVEKFPNGHPDLSNTLNNLGFLYSHWGKPEQATGFYERSLAMRERLYPAEKFPTGHPDISSSLTNLADVRATLGDVAGAFALYVRADAMEQASLKANFAGSSQDTMRSFLGQQSGFVDILVTLASKRTDDPATLAESYRIVAERKTILLDSLLRLREFERLAAMDPVVEQLTTELRALRQQVVDMAMRPATPETESRRKEIVRQSNILEAKLNLELSSRPGFKQPPDERPTVDRLATRLGDKSALIEIVRYMPHVFGAKLDEPRWDPSRYAAFVLRAGDPPTVSFVDLGPIEVMDSLIGAARASVIETRRELALSSEQQLETNYRAPATRLYESLLTPLQEPLAGATELIVGPDGELSCFPWEALVDSQGKYLIESISLSYVSSGADLLRDVPPAGVGTVVFAAPDYSLQGRPTPRARTLIAQLHPEEQLAAAPRAFAGEILDDEVRGLNWSNLPGTLEEARQIELLLTDHSEYQPLVKLTGADALEDTLKLIRGPRVLHLATHGFYLQNADRKEGAPDAQSEPDRGGTSAVARRARLARMDNPLLRAGLVMAGANRKDNESGQAPVDKQQDDGWVTAEEIGLLDLSGTELVVLSACETGLGDVERGQGVTGLRRAFVHAGARTLVTSLYKVPDKATQQLMVELYKRLAAGQPKREALRDAELAIIAKRRAEQGAAHPFFWASFILVGDPR